MRIYVKPLAKMIWKDKNFFTLTQYNRKWQEEEIQPAIFDK